MNQSIKKARTSRGQSNKYICKVFRREAQWSKHTYEIRSGSSTFLSIGLSSMCPLGARKAGIGRSIGRVSFRSRDRNVALTRHLVEYIHEDGCASIVWVVGELLLPPCELLEEFRWCGKVRQLACLPTCEEVLASRPNRRMRSSEQAFVPWLSRYHGSPPVIKPKRRKYFSSSHTETISTRSDPQVEIPRYE